MGKFMKDNYASTCAANSVKQALDQLIDVLQTSEELVALSQPRRKLHTKPPKVALETPAKTRPVAETPAPMANDTPNADPDNTITRPPVTDIPSDKRKTMNPGGYRPPRCNDPSRYISLDAYNQMWTKGLREYPGGSGLSPVQSGNTRLEAGWSCVPCKPGYLAAFANPVPNTSFT